MKNKYFTIAAAMLLIFSLAGTAQARFSQEREAQAEKLYNEAIALEKNGRFLEAIENAKKIVTDYPSPRYLPNTLLLLGLCHENIYEFKKALRYYRKVMHGYANYRIAKIARYKNDLIGKSYKNEKKPLIIFIQQERMIREKGYEKAIKRCERIIEQFPRSNLADNAQNTIGYIYLNYLKKYAKAKDAYQNLLDTYTDSSFRDNAIFAIGRSYERLCLYQSSLNYYNKLLEKHQGVFLPKNDYWSRVWTTKANARIEKIEVILDDLEEKNPLEKFVVPSKSVCISGEQTDDHKAYPLTDWIDPLQAGRFLGKKVTAETTAVFFKDNYKTVLKAWNYLLEHFELDSHRAEEWQFPEETASLKSGSERDISLLLASLLIHLEIKPKQVKVIYGIDLENTPHWWVQVDLRGKSYILSPAWHKEAPHKQLYLASHEGYQALLAFNNKRIIVKPGSPVPFGTCD